MGKHEKSKEKRQKDVKNVGERHPLLQLTGEHKKRKALETKRHPEEEEGRCET